MANVDLRDTSKSIRGLFYGCHLFSHIHELLQKPENLLATHCQNLGTMSKSKCIMKSIINNDSKLSHLKCRTYQKSEVTDHEDHKAIQLVPFHNHWNKKMECRYLVNQYLFIKCYQKETFQVCNLLVNCGKKRLDQKYQFK